MIFNVSKWIQHFFFFLFGWNKSQTQEFHHPTNYSCHFSHLNPKDTPRQEETRLSFTSKAVISYSLEIFSSFNHKWWIHPAQSLQTVHGWPLKAQWRPGILAILLSLSILCSLSIVYWLLVSSFLFIFLFFFCFFHFFISYLWLILDFYCFAISLLQNCLMIAHEGLWFFGAISSACKVFDKCSR